MGYAYADFTLSLTPILDSHFLITLIFTFGIGSKIQMRKQMTPIGKSDIIEKIRNYLGALLAGSGEFNLKA